MTSSNIHRTNSRRAAQQAESDLRNLQEHLAGIGLRHETLSSPHRLGT